MEMKSLKQELPPAEQDLLRQRTDTEPVQQIGPIKKKKVGGVRRILNAFFEISLIPAVTLVYQRISFLWKILWCLLAIAGLIMAIYQSKQLVINYLAYPSNLIEIEKVNRSVHFPAITLCSLNIINWMKIAENLDNPHYLALFTDVTQYDQSSTSSKFEDRLSLEQIVLDRLIQLNDTELQFILFGPNDWLKGCFIIKFGGTLIPCKNVHEFFLVPIFSPYYGSCITINPGFPGVFQLMEDSHTTIMIVTETPDDFDPPFLSHVSGMQISIHEPGSAPVIPYIKRMTLLPGNWLQLTSRVYELNRLAHPYASNCTSKDSSIAEDVKEFSPYQLNIKPYEYVYSRHECLAMCMQKNIMADLKCVNPFLAAGVILESAAMCGADDMNDEYMTELERSCANNCQLQCHEFLYDWTPVTQKIPKDDNFIQQFFDFVASNSTYYNHSDYMDDITSLISFSMESGVYIKGSEVPKLQLSDVFGSVGGNMGLWIGITMISIFEILELITQLAVHGFYQLQKYCKRRNQLRETDR